MRAGKYNPCKGCEFRAVGCHATCEVHAQWTEDLRAEQDKIYSIRNKERQLNSFVGENIARTKKRCGKEK